MDYVSQWLMMYRGQLDPLVADQTRSAPSPFKKAGGQVIGLATHL
jgi:hypothetical protein